MSEMLSYIFGSLHYSENAIRRINKTLVAQRKFNNTVTLFVIVTGANLVASHIESKRREEQIKKLEREIEELKQSEGE
jgi:hypothetical protein